MTLILALGGAMFLMLWKAEKTPIVAYVYLLAAIFSIGFVALIGG